jgi:hypothetical protein
MGYCFILKAGEYFSIEATEKTIKERYDELQEGNPYKMKICAVYQGDIFKTIADCLTKSIIENGYHFQGKWLKCEILDDIISIVEQKFNFIKL